MKKISNIILPILAIFFASVACQELSDINNTLEDEFTGPIRNDLKVTLPSATYKQISELAAMQATNAEEYAEAMKMAEAEALFAEHASNYIPDVLNSTPSLLGYGATSTIDVTFNYAEHPDSIISETTQTFEVGKSLLWQVPSIIKFQFEESDYKALTDYVKADAELSKYWESNYNGREIYYGSSARYKNFDMRYSTRAIEDAERDATFDETLVELYKAGLESGNFEELDKKLAERSLEGMMLMLEMKYAESGAKIQSKGSVITYEVRSLWFMDGFVNQYVICKYECVKESPNAEFKLVEGPIYE